MKISKIEQLKYKIKVVPETGEPLYFYPDTVYNFGLRKGDELSDEKVEEITDFDQYIYCKQKAFNLLSRRSHSAKELRLKLKAKDFRESVIQKTVNHLQEKSYLDDSQFAELFIRDRLKRKYGFNRIKRELFEKGIESTIITHYELLYSQDKFNLENAEILAVKKIKEIKRKENDRFKIRMKLGNYLYRRGFSKDIINKVADKLIIPE